MIRQSDALPVSHRATVKEFQAVGRWTNMTEATFTELRNTAVFDVVGSVGGPLLQ